MTGFPSPVRLSSIGSEEVDDPLLDRLDAAYTTPEERGLASGTRSGELAGGDPDDPFDFEVAKPAAYDLRRLYELSGIELPADHSAALGASVPLLICHGMTPFYKGGQRPTGVWGLGYAARLLGIDGDTVGFQPTGELIDVAKVQQEVTVGLAASGSFQFEPDLPVLRDLPGIQLPSAKLQATANQGIALAISCGFSIVAVVAGPIAAGGVRWDIYRAKRSIETFQPLFQTLRVPAGVGNLRFEVETWVRRSGSFFGLIGARHWHYPAQTFEVSLAGLES